MAIEDRGAVLILDGPFRLILPDGTEADIAEKKNRALIAMLATAPGQRRSRQWLKEALWSRTGKPQNSYSLRQALSKLRGALEGEGGIFHTDRDAVWLSGLRVVRPDSPDRADRFFSDASVPDLPFREWLMAERRGIARGGQAPRRQASESDRKMMRDDQKREAARPASN